jgi:pimeloyl-ACP methyl ester carboxylesterase
MLATARESAPALARLMRTQILSTVPEKRIPYLPTLILWGEQDEISPLRVGERLQKVIPGAELTTISNTRHAPHIEEPEIVAFQIKTFLDHPGKSSTRDLPGAGMLG